MAARSGLRRLIGCLWRWHHFAKSLAVLATAFAATFATGTATAWSLEQAEAAGTPFKIALFVSSRTDACYGNGYIGAITRLATLQQSEINRRGGIAGRPISLMILDDQREPDRMIANLRTALAEPQLIAMVGMSSSTRSKAAFDAMGDAIKASGVPFISDVSLSSLFADYPNVFTTRASQDEDGLPIIAGFTRKFNFSRVAFVGLKDIVSFNALGDALKAEIGEAAFVADIRLERKDDKLAPDDIAAAVAKLKETQPELIYLYTGTSNAELFIKAFNEAGIAPALFVGGRLEGIDPDVTKVYTNAIYALNWDHPPEVYNDRIRKLIKPQHAQDWIFEGEKNATAPGWTNGKCKSRPEVEFVDALNDGNIRALTVGSQFADMVGLVAEAARVPERTTEVAQLRRVIVEILSTVFQAGRGSYDGSFDNWSFVAKTRAAARDPFVIILPQGLGRTQLAPFQFVRSKDGSLRPMETLYVDVDLIKAHRIDENEKTFFAEFYLAMRANEGATIDKIEFANAYLDAQSENGRQLTVETIHAGGSSAAYPDSMLIYKVSGRFLLDPDLTNYPFDAQRFSIDLQPKSGDTPFIVQPPPLLLRDKRVDVDGWQTKDQYVGYDQRLVPVVDAYTHRPSIVPFYKASFIWLMQRETTDYLLRVAVPLAFIMFVAYLSIFIPQTHFEAIVTIQVTALLSAVALYLSLPKLDSDTATLSDRAFVFAYMIVSLMIGISILRVSPLVSGRTGADRVMKLAHIAIIPIMVALAALYVCRLSTLGR